MDQFKTSYEGLGPFKLKRKFEHVKGMEQVSNKLFYFNSELKEIGDTLKIVKEKVKPYAQAYIGELANKKNLVTTYENPDHFVVQSFNNKFYLDYNAKGQLSCSCNAKIKCCHIIAVELFLNKQTILNDDLDVNLLNLKKKIEKPKKSGRKGGEEEEEKIVDNKDLIKKTQQFEIKANKETAKKIQEIEIKGVTESIKSDDDSYLAKP